MSTNGESAVYTQPAKKKSFYEKCCRRNNQTIQHFHAKIDSVNLLSLSLSLFEIRQGLWTLLDRHAPGGTGLWKELVLAVAGAWVMVWTRTLFSNAGEHQHFEFCFDRAIDWTGPFEVQYCTCT